MRGLQVIKRNNLFNISILRHIILIIVSIFYLTASNPLIGNTAEYNLLDIYKIALEQSERIQGAEQDLYISQQSKEKAEAALFFPRLTALGMYQSNALNEGLSSYGIRAYGLELDKSFSLGGGEIYGYKMSKIAIDKSKRDIKTVKADYLIDVSTYFINILRAQKMVEINKTNVERLKKHRDAAEIRLKLGEIIKTPVLRAEAELSGADVELFKSENDLNLAKAVLARMIGISGDYSIINTEEINDLNSSITLDQFKDTAIKQRTEVQSLELTDALLEQNINISNSAFWPVVTFQLTYSNFNLGPTMQYLNTQGTYAGVMVSYPIFEGGIRRNEVNTAKAQRKKASLALSELKKSIYTEIESLYLEYITQKQIIKSLTDQVSFSKENYNLVFKQFTYGLATSLDVMDANNLLLRSETGLTDAKYKDQLLLIKLKRAGGIFLTEIEAKINANSGLTDE